jgi:thiosulfate dehydrogenase (quinone) large subunit
MSEYPGHLLPRLRTEWGLAGLRILLGWLFMWGFLDKMFGLGYATISSHAWINGYSPTKGYLAFATSGPLEGFYNGLAGNTLVDIVFMLALLALGIALILGIGMRLALYGGSIFLLMLWSTNLPPANNPIIDEHIIFIAALFVLERMNAGNYIGLGKRWGEMKLVKRFPILR